MSKKIDRKITAKITTLNDDFDRALYLIMQGASQTLASPGPLSRDPALCQEGAAQVNIYESLSDVGEIRVYFASKILTPCRMH